MTSNRVGDESIKAYESVDNAIRGLGALVRLANPENEAVIAEIMDIEAAARNSALKLGGRALREGGESALRGLLAGKRKAKRMAKAKTDGSAVMLGDTPILNKKKARQVARQSLSGQQDELVGGPSPNGSPSRSPRRKRVKADKVSGLLVRTDRSYRADEIIPLLADFKAQDKPIGATIKALVHKDRVGGSSIRSMQKRVKMYRNGNKVGALAIWNSRGRPSLATEEELLEIRYKCIPAGSAQTMNERDLHDALVGLRKEKLRAKGIVPASDLGIDPKTLTLYKQKLRHLTGNEAWIMPNHKTSSRLVSENSIRSMAGYAATVLATHHIPKSEYPAGYNVDDVDRVAAGKDGLLKGQWVKPCLIFSTDDTTIALGKTNDGKREYVIGDKEYDGKVRAAFNTSNRAKTFTQIMRVTMTVTLNADGYCAPPRTFWLKA
jgi:hypothetical protein